MKRHRQIEPSARNLSTALSTVHATFADADLLAAANTDALVADLPVLDTGEPHLARRSLRYRRAAKMRRQYLEERRDGRWPLPTPTTFLS